MPIIFGRKGKADFTFLLDKIRSKFSGWRASSLSQAGRISLARSCVMSVPCYVIQMSKIPVSICDEVEHMCRDFIWGSTPKVCKNHLISWSTICSPKEKEGLSFCGLRMVNSAFLMKLGWGVISKKDSLWAQVLRFKYGYGNLTIPSINCGSRASHLWGDICQVLAVC